MTTLPGEWLINMSDLPRIDNDTMNPLTLRIAAITLAGVVGAFVSYWAAYGVHILFDLIAHQFAHSTLSWVLSVLIGIFVGLGSAYRLYLELSRYAES